MTEVGDLVDERCERCRNLSEPPLADPPLALGKYARVAGQLGCSYCLLGFSSMPRELNNFSAGGALGDTGGVA